MEAPIHRPLGRGEGEEGRPAAVAQPQISIAIVSYNTKELLARCLETLATSNPQRSLEVIVVDNDSHDGTPDWLRAEHPEVRLIANRDNLGYSAAVNQAIHTAAGKYVLILNPDIEVMAGSIDALAEHMDQNPETGIAGGKLLNPDGTLQYSCRTFYTLETLLHRRTPIGKLFPNSRVVRDHLMMDWDHESVREVDWMLGACMMVRREAIHEVGLMDERFFMYFEDVDWCYRMKVHGWRVVYVPDAEMRHVHRRESAKGGIFNRRLAAHLSSMFRFFDKWNSALYRLRKRRDTGLAALLLLGDAAAVNLAFLGAFALRSMLSSVLQRPVFPFSAYDSFLLLTNGVVLAVNALLGLYLRPSSRDTLDDGLDLFKGLLFSILVLMASTFLTGSELHSRLMVGAFAPLAFAGMLLMRVGLGSLTRALRRGRFDVTQVVVLGEREAARELSEHLAQRPETGLEVVATLPDRPGDEERRFREFWDAEGIREVIHRHRVGEVLLVKPTLSGAELARLVLRCRRDGVRVRMVSGVAEFLPGQLPVGEVLGRPAVDVGAVAGRPIGRSRRRLFDVLFAVLATLIQPWAWGRVLRGVPAESAQEAIYGWRGRTFARRLPGDRRMGDTLGQILRGELAIVGPRPRSPEEVAASDDLAVLFDLVRPGWTGPWRLHAQDHLSREEEVSLEFSYLQNQSVWEDLKVVLRSLRPRRPHPGKSRSNV